MEEIVTPIIGISQKLDYVFLKPSGDGENWEEYEPLITTEKYEREHDVLIIHKDDAKVLFSKKKVKKKKK